MLLDGSVEIPGWAERRRHSRWSVDWPAVLHLGPSDVHAQLVNISLSGLYLTTVEQLRQFETVSVNIGSGRCLTAQVIWCQGQTYGMKFSTVLLATDPVIIAAKSR